MAASKAGRASSRSLWASSAIACVSSAFTFATASSSITTLRTYSFNLVIIPCKSWPESHFKHFWGMHVRQVLISNCILISKYALISNMYKYKICITIQVKINIQTSLNIKIWINIKICTIIQICINVQICVNVRKLVVALGLKILF